MKKSDSIKCFQSFGSTGAPPLLVEMWNDKTTWENRQILLCDTVIILLGIYRRDVKTLYKMGIIQEYL